MSAPGVVALLDVNILVALFESDHVHHELAHDWFADQRVRGWATCPLTENGFVRVLSKPAHGKPPIRSTELIDRLRTFCASGHHTFWTETVSLRDKNLFSTAFVRGPKQLTDVYLLGLARKMKGCLATFDRSIPLSAVVGATRDNLMVISAAADE